MSKKFVSIILTIVLILAVGYLVFNNILPKKSTPKIVTQSTLIDAVDIAVLSSAEFNYTGIAEAYSDEQRKNIKCRICYHATVKAGIDEKIDFIINDDKTVTVHLPELHLNVIILDDPPMSTIPVNTDIELPEMRKWCKEDAEREAKESATLMKEARESLISSIETLVTPLLEPQGYKLNPIQ